VIFFLALAAISVFGVYFYCKHGTIIPPSFSFPSLSSLSFSLSGYRHHNNKDNNKNNNDNTNYNYVAFVDKL
jgi:hypothetical protein